MPKYEAPQFLKIVEFFLNRNKKNLLWKRKTSTSTLADNSYFVNLTFTSYVLEWLLSEKFEQIL